MKVIELALRPTIKNHLDRTPHLRAASPGIGEVSSHVEAKSSSGAESSKNFPGGSQSTFYRLSQLAQELHWKVQFETQVEGEKIDLKAWLHEGCSKGNVTCVRLDLERFAEHLSFFSERPSLVDLQNAMDHLIFQNGKWWPRLFHYEAIRLAMMHKSRVLDTLSCAYVVGDNVLGGVCVSVLMGMGFDRIHWLGDNLELLKQRIQKLKAKRLGTEIVPHKLSMVTTLSEKGSVMLCSIDLFKQRDLLADLLYFNYIKKDGLIGNLLGTTEKNTLLVEANKADLVGVSSVDLNLELDWQLVNRLNLAKDLQFSNFESKWLSISA